MGVVCAPFLKLLYFSSKTIGSYKFQITNDFEFINLDTLISKSAKLPFIKNDIKTIVVSRSHINKKTKLYIDQLKKLYGKINVISKGSSLKICLVAEGFADYYPRLGPTMEWDIAAAHSVCKYAKSNIYDLETKKEIKYNKKELLNNSFIVK